MDKANRNFDKANATRDKHGNITAKNQHGIDRNAKPRKSDNKNWCFGDSLTDVTPGRTIEVVVEKAIKKFHIDSAKYHLHKARVL